MPVPTHIVDSFIVISPTFLKHSIRSSHEWKNTYQIGGGHVLVKHLHHDVVADVFDLEVEGLVPLRGLAGALEGSGAELLHARLEDAVGVHLAEELRVAGESRLDHLNAQASLLGHIFAGMQMKI